MTNNDYIVLSHKQNSLVCEFILKKRFFDGVIEKNNYHFHSLFEVHVCVTGRMHISVEDRDIFLVPGEICIIPPQKVHYVSADGNSFNTGFRFSFTNSAKTKTAHSALLKNAFAGLEDAVVISQTEIYDRYLRIAAENITNSKPDFMSADLIFLALYELADSISEKDFNSAVYRTDSNITISETTEDFVNQNYNKKISLEDIATQLNLGKRQTQRTVSSLFGMTFTELLNKKRLTAAKLLLKTTDKSVEEIAYLCGFEDKNYFYRRFSAMFGTTPGKYRSTNKQ